VSEPFGFDQECNVGEWVEIGQSMLATRTTASGPISDWPVLAAEWT